MIKGIIEDEFFYCNHIGASVRDESDISSFTVKANSGEGLVRYIQHFAFPDEEAGLMRTYLVRFKSTDELVGYFSLKAGLISVNESQTDDGVEFDTIPGVELANFAVDYGFVKKHNAHGLGSIIFDDFVKPLIQETSKEIGIRMIYLFALPFESLINTYADYGFKRLSGSNEYELHKRLKPRYDESCIFMFRDLNS